MDRRITPFSGRFAHVSLQGRSDPELAHAVFVEGEAARITSPLTFLHAKPDGAIDRQLIFGDEVTVIDRNGAQAYVTAAKDGYCGWIHVAALGAPRAPSHRIRHPATHLYPAAKVQAVALHPLYLNARITVIAETDGWSETPDGFVPTAHLAALADHAPDPVGVAETLLHAPYLWGGNSVAGVDCSGLVQLSLLAAGQGCPGDSDLQKALGTQVPAGTALRRGDLLFWKGHVAWVAAPDTILHANGHSMDVRFERLEAAISRIRAQGGGEVTARRRLDLG